MQFYRVREYQLWVGVSVCLIFSHCESLIRVNNVNKIVGDASPLPERWAWQCQYPSDDKFDGYRH